MKQTNHNLPLRNERGQSLILALLIMFLLVFLGGVFVALISRNVGRTQRSTETLSADYLAEAGVRYASDQLTYSGDGADWRPVPTYPMVVQYIETNRDPNTLLAAQKPNPQDPDYEWLMLGYSRFTYGKGRFLLRVTYDPTPHDPMSKYIRIESVGRMGIVDQTDPTTWLTKQSSRLKSERVAYKAIGITDYSRFITNKDRRPGQFSLGAPGFETQFGVWNDTNKNGKVDIDVNPDIADPTKTTATSEAYGGSIRVNGDLLWHGKNDVWINPLRNEDVEVAGDIQFDVYQSKPTTPGATEVRVNQYNATRSADPFFDTLMMPITGISPPDAGVYRDGRTATDENGRPRNIVRLDPPLIDARGPAGGVSRYRELTRNSGEWVWNTDRGEWFNTGFYGWGAGIYIDNRQEIQAETELATLKNEWLTPGSSQYWVGPYYIPPGVLVILTPYDLSNPPDGKPDMILIRNDATPSNPVWYDRNGKALVTQGGRMIMPYPDSDSNPANGNSGVLFAEGNIRIKGTLPSRTQLTVVSGGTIYVEGSILRYPWKNDPKQTDEAPLPYDEPRDSAIALLATDHVCVNTTQFFGPMEAGMLPVNWRPDLSSFIASVSQPLYLNWAFGVDPTRAYVTTSGDQLPVRAYLRHTAAAGDVPCYVNMSINEFGYGANATGAPNPWWGLYNFAVPNWVVGSPPLPDRDYIWPLADLGAAQTFDPADPSQCVAEQKWPMWEHWSFSLIDANNLPAAVPYTFHTDPGVLNSIGFHVDQNYAKGDYLLSRMAIQPCDVRIEALMYAQNGSFFVIPGDWFNPDTNDLENGVDSDKNGIPDYRDPGVKRHRIADTWPFYGQPLDCCITVMGAISENVPASIAEVGAWMDKWGWIPAVHGCSTDTTQRTITYRSPLNPADAEGTPGVKQRGLTIIYDSSLSYPKVPDPAYLLNRNKDLPVRVDDYYRVLPMLPKLPVSPETLYFGRPA